MDTYHDVSLSHSGISNQFISNFLRTRDLDELQVRYVDAKEVSERVVPELISSNTEQTITLMHSVDNTIVALETVLSNLDSTLQFCLNASLNVHQRINFHQLVALAGVKYVIHNNFVRGWEMIEERTVRHVTTEFYETINAYDRTIQQLKEPSKDDMLPRKVVYIMMDQELSSRLELAIRAIDNTTTAYMRFLEAEPILNYGFTEAKLYELSLVPVTLLSNLTTQHKAYYENMSLHLTGYMNSILSLQNLLHDAFRNRAINETAYSITSEQFVDQSKKINYYRFLFTKRIVHMSEQMIDEKIASFSKKNKTLHATVSFLQAMLSTLQGRIRNGLTKLRDALQPFVKKARDYLHETAIMKTELYRTLMERKLQDIVHATKSIFLDLRKRDNEIRDWVHRMERSYTGIWSSIIDDVTTRKFYRLLWDHVASISTESNKTNRISRGVLQLLQITGNVEDIQRSRLASVMNADTVKLSLANKTNEIRLMFTTVYQDVAIDKLLANWDMELVESFNIFSKNLHQFWKSTNIDEDFIRYVTLIKIQSLL